MPTPPRKPVPPTIVLSAALVLMLAVGYAMSYGFCLFLDIRGLLPPDVFVVLDGTVYAPLRWYAYQDLPGRVMFWRYVEWCAAMAQ